MVTSKPVLSAIQKDKVILVLESPSGYGLASYKLSRTKKKGVK